MSARYEYIDGHRVPVAPGDAPAGSEPGEHTRADQQIRPGAPDVRTAPELLCDPAVTCGLHWTYDGGSVPVVALLLPPHIAYALVALLPDPIQRDALNGAAGAVALELDAAEIGMEIRR